MTWRLGAGIVELFELEKDADCWDGGSSMTNEFDAYEWTLAL